MCGDNCIEGARGNAKRTPGGPHRYERRLLPENSLQEVHVLRVCTFSACHCEGRRTFARGLKKVRSSAAYVKGAAAWTGCSHTTKSLRDIETTPQMFAYMCFPGFEKRTFVYSDGNCGECYVPTVSYCERFSPNTTIEAASELAGVRIVFW